MAWKKRRTKARTVSEKTPRTYRLSPKKIAAARRILGARTATATIEQALDMVVFRKEIVDGTSHRSSAGVAS